MAEVVRRVKAVQRAIPHLVVAEVMLLPRVITVADHIHARPRLRTDNVVDHPAHLHKRIRIVDLCQLIHMPAEITAFHAAL